MNIRRETIYVTDKVIFYAHILVKAKGGDMKIDQLIDAELTDKWEREYPKLVEAYDKNCAARQISRKTYEQIESDVIASISPVPGGKLQN